MLKKTAVLSLGAAILYFNNCTHTPTVNHSSQVSTSMLKEGEQLAKAYCYSCHSPDMSKNERIAPPFQAVKSHYLKNGVLIADFTDQITNFVKQPKLQNTKMPGAVKKFNLMPQLPLPDTVLEKIAYYMYYADLKKPSWFSQHQKEEMDTYIQDLNIEEKEYLAKGKKYAMASQKALGGQLINAISLDGPIGALTFCNTNALALTDSLSTYYGVKISRKSDQFRNPLNAASLNELQYIFKSKQRIVNNEELHPSLFDHGDNMVAYFPILTNAMCLQCHGASENEISSDLQLKLKELYPDDRAQNYKANDLRGIWVIEIPKSKNLN